MRPQRTISSTRSPLRGSAAARHISYRERRGAEHDRYDADHQVPGHPACDANWTGRRKDDADADDDEPRPSQRPDPDPDAVHSQSSPTELYGDDIQPRVMLGIKRLYQRNPTGPESAHERPKLQCARN